MFGSRTEHPLPLIWQSGLTAKSIVFGDNQPTDQGHLPDRFGNYSRKGPGWKQDS
jgi:hypothetical protein